MPLAAKIAIALAALLVLPLAGLAVFSQIESAKIAARFPNTGERVDIGGGMMMNGLHVPAGPAAELPPIVFIHGASGNLNDPAGAFLATLTGRAELLFVDRPGHGYSDAGGPEMRTPSGQADAIVALMDKLGIDRAIIVGHSFGAAITMALALDHPDRVAGLVFLAPATHPWPGGVDWYYDVASLPVIGPLFCNTLATPAGLMRIEGGATSVFSPNPVPEGYLDRAEIALVLRPANFCNNARDVAGLHDWVAKNQPRYSGVTAPSVIITGDRDDIVLEELHSRGLARDLPNSELLWIHGLGHKPDYIATDLAVAAIERVAGQPRDLATLARKVEARIAGRTGPVDNLALGRKKPDQMPASPSAPI